MDLTNKRFCIFGLQRSGKTELTKHILRGVPNHFVYDPLDEYDGFNRYKPDDRNSIPELSDCIQKLVIPRVKPDLFIIDEANRYILPKPTPIPAGVDELNDWAGHMGLSWGAICRRPVQFHSDITELAHVVFFFILQGRNDSSYMDDLLPNLSTTVSTLPQHHFAILETGSAGRVVSVHSPIPI